MDRHCQRGPGQRSHPPKPASRNRSTTMHSKNNRITISNAHAGAQLTASRARVVAAADDARRRLERDLHDGIQQGLVSLALALREAEAMAPPEPPALLNAIAEVTEG